MQSKADLTKRFLNLAAKEAARAGYIQKPRNVFSKFCAAGSILVTRYEFFGSSLVDVVGYVGVRLPSVEGRLIKMAFFEGWPASTTRETVFQKMDAAVAIISQDRIPSSYKIPEDEKVQIVAWKKYVGSLELVFCDDIKLASYCLKDASLPIGHHAFRIPFILRDAGIEDECQSYMKWVSAKSFINQYDKFIKEFNGRL